MNLTINKLVVFSIDTVSLKCGMLTVFSIVSLAFVNYFNSFSLKITFSSVDSLYGPYRKEIQISVVFYVSQNDLLLQPI